MTTTLLFASKASDDYTAKILKPALIAIVIVFVAIGILIFMIVLDIEGFWTDFCARGRLYGEVLARVLTRLMLTHHLRWSALCLNLTHVYN